MKEKVDAFQKVLTKLLIAVVLFGILMLLTLFIPNTESPASVQSLPHIEFTKLLVSFCQKQMGAEPASISFNPFSNSTYVWCQLTNDEGWFKSEFYTRDSFELWLDGGQPRLEGGSII